MENTRKPNPAGDEQEQKDPTDSQKAGENPGTEEAEEEDAPPVTEEPKFSAPRITGLITEVSRAGFTNMSGAKWIEYESGTAVLIPVRNEYLMVFDSLSSLEAYVNKFGSISHDTAPDPSTILMASKIRIPA